MTTQQQVGIEMLKEWIDREYQAKPGYSTSFEDGVNMAKSRVKEFLKMAGL